MKRFWGISLLLAGLVLCACSSNPVLESQSDASSPSHGSIYYFFAGVYNQQLGNYQAADTALRKSISYDHRSYQSQRYLLLNQLYEYLTGSLSKEDLDLAVSSARERIVFDETILQNLYNCYQSASDTLAVMSTLDELEQRYPSARIHFLRFVNNYNYYQNIDTAALENALEANPEPELKLNIAQVYLSLDPAKALAILDELKRDENNTQAAALWVELTLRMEDYASFKESLEAFDYPQDSQMIDLYLEGALLTGNGNLILEYAPRILAWDNPDFIEKLTNSAFFFADSLVINQVETYIEEAPAGKSEISTLVPYVLVYKLVNHEKAAQDALVSRLISSTDIHSIADLYLIHQQPYQAVNPATVDAEVYTRLKQAWLNLSSDDQINDFFNSYCLFRRGLLSDEDFYTAGLAIARYLVSKGLGGLTDYQIMIGEIESKPAGAEKEKLLRQALAAFPSQAQFLNALGYYLIAESIDLEEGAELVRHALSLEPMNYFYMDSLAWYYYQLGDYQTALSHMEIAMVQDNVPAEIAYHLGMIHYKLGMSGEAAIWFGRAAAVDDGSGYDKKAAAMLEQMQ